MEQQGRSFGQAADAYSAARPDYPRDAVAWLLGDARDVVDVGAGTGKLTAVVAALGRRVTAVEPDAGMLARLERDVPGVPAHLGTAESIPLPDASADAVVLGQAWHWVDVPRAAAECARVLRPGGTLGLVWNVRDEREPWVADLTRTMHGSDAEQLIASGGPEVGPPFGPLEERRWRWTRPLTVDGVLDLAASRSYLIALEEEPRAAVLASIRRLLAEHPGTRGRATVSMPYITVAYRTRTAETPAS